MVFALAATGAGLLRVTTARGSVHPAIRVPEVKKPTLAAVPFRLILSAPAAAVEIDTGSVIRPLSNRSPVSGTLNLDPNDPRVGLVVRWENAAIAGEHRFAKLTLEAPGQETFTHVFDADGDINDFLELPLPAEK